MVCFAGNIACSVPGSLKRVLKCSFDSIRLAAWSSLAPLRSGSDTPSPGSTPTPASLRTACWGSWGPWLVGWAGWPAPPRWAPCPPPPPSASPAASAAPAPPLCWSSGCRCKRRSVGLMRRSFKTVEIFDTAQIFYPTTAPGFTVVVQVISPHSGAERRVELLLFVMLQVEGLQRVHGPVEQRVIQQHLHST